jgi:hypothetical protein
MNIQTKPLFRAAILATTLLAGSAVINVASPAAAQAATWYDNVVLEGYGSTANIQILAPTATVYKTMRPNTSSNGWPTFIPNVAKFHIPKGYVGVSRWGYGYKGGVWYSFSSSHNDLFLQVETEYCWYLRSQLGTPCKVPLPS